MVVQLEVLSLPPLPRTQTLERKKKKKNTKKRTTVRAVLKHRCTMHHHQCHLNLEVGQKRSQIQLLRTEIQHKTIPWIFTAICVQGFCYLTCNFIL